MSFDVNKVEQFENLSSKRRIGNFDLKNRGEWAWFIGEGTIDKDVFGNTINDKFGLMKGRRYFINIDRDNGYVVSIDGFDKKLRYGEMRFLLSDWSFDDNIEIEVDKISFGNERLFGYA